MKLIYLIIAVVTFAVGSFVTNLVRGAPDNSCLCSYGQSEQDVRRKKLQIFYCTFDIAGRAPVLHSTGDSAVPPKAKR